MYNVWDKVKVKSWLELDKKYWIIDCDEDHINAHWMEWEIIEVYGEGVWYKLSFDPWLTFDEWMLELTAPTKVAPAAMQNPAPVQAPYVSKKQVVSNRLRSYVQMISKLEEVDKTMFFEMIYDKLESILFETYWE